MGEARTGPAPGPDSINSANCTAEWASRWEVRVPRPRPPVDQVSLEISWNATIPPLPPAALSRRRRAVSAAAWVAGTMFAAYLVVAGVHVARQAPGEVLGAAKSVPVVGRVAVNKTAPTAPVLKTTPNAAELLRTPSPVQAPTAAPPPPPHE
ncbi:hypothetical protein [Pseudonocardia sp. TRM90224]|uniref:hypothetical protein n=1 Tax=Pseudonocardia sp. TRM90224 TaxID=2812678 RepID=UPI001E3458BA|nr:hypothetical protein [Pseudonocardia sp. TRM90224]